MTVKYCWSYADNDAIGDFDSREDAVADFERSLIEEDYELDVGTEVEVTTYESVSVVEYLNRCKSIIAVKADEIVNGYADNFLGINREYPFLSADDLDSLGDAILNWYKAASKLSEQGVLRSPVAHTVTVPSND